MSDSGTLSDIRAQFPTLKQRVHGLPLIYLDNAATTHKPEAVIQAVDSYYRCYNANVHRASHALSADATTQFEAARGKVAQYINAKSAKEIIWSKGTTEAINLVAHCLGEQLCPGDEILISSMEHHANIVPWQMLAERKKLNIKVIPLLQSGELDLNAYQQLLTEKTRLVAITHVSNVLGSINPIKEMIKLAHQAEALVLVDGAQALPHIQVDVQSLDADFYVFSGHKVFAPTGIGALYAKLHLLEALPPWQGGGEMIEQVSFIGTTYNQVPFKFEAGTPNIAGVIGLGAAIDWLAQQDHQRLRQQEQLLFSTALEGCKQIKGFQRIGSAAEHVSLLSFTLAGQQQQDVGFMLDKKGIALRTGHHCAMPLMDCLGIPGTLRAAFAFYNTLAEVQQFVTALDTLLSPEQVALITTAPSTLSAKLRQTTHWNERYREILLAGKNLPKLPEALKVASNQVRGCESQTWICHQQTEHGTLQFQVDSDAKIIRGLLALVLEIFNNKSAAEILNQDIGTLFQELDLEKHLSPSRGNGLKAVINRIYDIARQSQAV